MAREPLVAPALGASAPDGHVPSRAEAIAFAVAGVAFAVSLSVVSGATPLPRPVLLAPAALAAAWGLAPAMHRATGAAAGTVARGVGAFVAVLVLLPSLGENLPVVARAVAVAVAGVTALQASTRVARGGLALATVGLGLALVGLAMAFVAADAFPEPARLRFALLFGGALLVAGLLARAALARSKASALAPTPVGVFAAAAILSVYVSYRPLAAERVENLPLYEWALAAGVAVLALGRIRRLAAQSMTPEAWSSDARRHAQDVRPVYDARMMPLAAVFQRYLEHALGFEEYRRALEAANGAPLPPHLAQALEAARGGNRGLPKARREAAQRRLAAHEAALAHLSQSRGTNHHGSPQRRVRTHP